METKLEAELDKEFNIASERRSAGNIIYPAFKRLFDIAASLVGLVVLSPVCCIAAAMIKAEDGGPVFYKQERIGRNGASFVIYKFRSMKVNAEELDKMLSKEELSAYYKEYKLERDPRITRIGALLRASSIDEIPQLINILKGDMSLVGPRPVLLRETYFFGADRERFLSVRPGLTGYWQVYARNNADYESGRRQQMELYYIDNCGLRLDMKIIFKTFGAVIRKTGK